MFFTRLATIAAWLAFSTAAFRISLAVYGLTGTEEAAFFATRYLGTKNFGPALDQAAVMAAFAIGLGVLAEISRALRR